MPRVTELKFTGNLTLLVGLLILFFPVGLAYWAYRTVAITRRVSAVEAQQIRDL